MYMNKEDFLKNKREFMRTISKKKEIKTKFKAKRIAKFNYKKIIFWDNKLSSMKIKNYQTHQMNNSSYF